MKERRKGEDYVRKVTPIVTDGRVSIGVIGVHYHRNGVSGAGFHIVHFKDLGLKKEMFGIVFDDKGYVAVLGKNKVSNGVFGFGANSWRGDWFEAVLRKAIKSYEDSWKGGWLG